MKYSCSHFCAAVLTLVFYPVKQVYGLGYRSETQTARGCKTLPLVSVPCLALSTAVSLSLPLRELREPCRSGTASLQMLSSSEHFWSMLWPHAHRTRCCGNSPGQIGHGKKSCSLGSLTTLLKVCSLSVQHCRKLACR